MDPDADPDPATFVSDLQDVKKKKKKKKKKIIRYFFAYYLLFESKFRLFSKIKSHKEVTKQLEPMFFKLLLDDEGYGSQTNGSGSGRSKSISMNLTDPDPQ
jgi:hypothetical protein